MTLHPTRAETILASFATIIEPHGRILDIGAGKGLLAQAMTRQLNARVTMVDIASYNQTNLPLAVCDSRSLAFADNSYDYAILSFVLHHTQKPQLILSEALRVARAVIVVENEVRGRWRGILTRAIDSWPAIRYGTPPCYLAQTREEWMEIFTQFPVQVRVLAGFSLEFGFFQNMTALLSKQTN
jgi:SAM-dependent methyltransferase